LTSYGEELGLGLGGIPENTATLVYGPPNVGKSIFCFMFAYHGLTQDEPCLYLTTNKTMQELLENMMDLGLELENFRNNEMFYVVDATSHLSDKYEESEIYQLSSVLNPTDILVKVSQGARSISQKTPRFRSIIDSLTTILESNNEMIIMRVLKTYLMRVKEVGGTPLITYDEGTADPRTEIIIKSMVDNIIRLDGEEMIIESMKGSGKKQSAYTIAENGINILESDFEQEQDIINKDQKR
jgi:KaiC/GvpD/RAD55 family RecA-like ATPase